jgi:anti-sigma factor RsiW
LPALKSGEPMLSKESHLSDQELILAADGEISPRRAEQVAAHLMECWSCRARNQEIEGAVTDFIRLHRGNLDPLLPPSAGSRALLKAQLAQMALAPQPWFNRMSQIVPWKRIAVAVFLTAIIGVGYQAWMSRSAHRPSARLVPLSIPEPGLTPGAVATVNKDQVCRAPRPENRKVSASLQHRVFEEYGIANAVPQAYEVDYLITPALGGADDIRNLWPQSYSSAVWNAHVKDALEGRLRQLVCDGSLDLVAAQHDISSDWIAAYKKYFRTDRPLETAH